MDDAGRLNRYAKFVAFATFCLIFAGGLVTSTGSGLSVPDWPLSFGKFFPKMKGGVRFEHGHRMVAGIVVILTGVLVAWILKSEKRVFIRRLGVGAFSAILLQAALGGLTVLLKLPPLVSVAHAGLAQAFFCSTVALALVTSKAWKTDVSCCEDEGTPPLAGLSLITTALIVLQILLGAVMRHIGAGLAIPDFPLSFGRIVPPSAAFTPPIAIAFAHRLGAVAVGCCVVWTAARALRFSGSAGGFKFYGMIALVLLGLQIFLGGLTIMTGKAVIPTTLHVAVGALLLAVHVIMTLQAFRFTRRSSRPLAVGPLPA